MPHEHPAIKALIDNPDNWLTGDVGSPGKIGLSSLFRTLRTPIPPPPQTAKKIAGAFKDYRGNISEILRPRGMPQETWLKLSGLLKAFKQPN